MSRGNAVIRQAWVVGYRSYRASYRVAPHMGVATESAFEDVLLYLADQGLWSGDLWMMAMLISDAAEDAFFWHRYGV